VTAHTITLADPAGGATARILVDLGFNCYDLRLTHLGRQIPVLWSEPGFETGRRQAGGSGNPILFPYPGRLRGKVLHWQEHAYPLEGDDQKGNAIHGFVLTRPWRIVEQAADRVVGQFQAQVDDPQLLARWPADFRITATYELARNELRTSYQIENPDGRPLPCGLGLHPYFRVPLGGGSADACRVELPVTTRWELTDMLPTGRTRPIEHAERYRAGLPFADMAGDDVFGGLVFEGESSVWRVVDPGSGLQLRIAVDRAFRACVVYNPPHREAVCLEPYTCVPNAIELSAAGVESGWRMLPPGESFQARMTIRLE
jgi:aldose 1-epimerase